MSIREVFNRVSESILISGAKHDSVRLAKIAFGHTNVGANSKALRVAAENKSYNVFAYMLMTAAEGIMPGNMDFALDENYKRVKELAKTDKRLADIMQKKEETSEKAFQKFFGVGAPLKI